MLFQQVTDKLSVKLTLHLIMLGYLLDENG
jgi:hypothetical protein